MITPSCKARLLLEIGSARKPTKNTDRRHGIIMRSKEALIKRAKRSTINSSIQREAQVVLWTSILHL